jgi:transposase
MALITLNRRERRTLQHLITHPADATTLRRAQALVWLDGGESVQKIALRLQVSRQVIYQWVARFQDETQADLALRLVTGPRSGRPRTVAGIIDPLLDEVIDHDPRTCGFNSTVWTAPLLVAYLSETHGLVVSVQSVRLALRRLEITWKRPRHLLALRSRWWRQAKGGLKRGWRRESAPSS